MLGDAGSKDYVLTTQTLPKPKPGSSINMPAFIACLALICFLYYGRRRKF